MSISILTFTLLGAIWLLLSGHYDALLLSFGLASVLGTLWCVHRMRQPLLADAQLHRSPIEYRTAWLESVRYSLWLAKEITVSNIDVARRVWQRDMPIDPVTVVVNDDELDEVGKVIYANSITLTPGTVSLFLRDDGIHVHALTQDGARQLAKGEMLARVRRLRIVRVPG